MSFISELQRRNVFKVGVAYGIVAWLLVQVIVAVETPLHLPNWFDTAIIVLLIIGFPIALLFAWAFELTPEGIKRTGQTGDRDTSSFEANAPDVEPVPPLKSVAVLPFADMSPDRDQEYFSDGISEELLNLLTRVPDLKVIARTSSFSYKGKDVPITQIARELNVAHVLEGSVRKSGDRVRITVQLIRASDSSHLWSETYDRTMEDIFAIQDQVAGAVVKELKIKLLGEVPSSTPVNPEAYVLYLQGLHMTLQTSFEKAIEFYQQAVEREPDFAQAWSLLAALHATIRHGRGLRDHAEPAQIAVNRALALDPDNALAYAALGWVALSQCDVVEAARCFQRALALDPRETGICPGAGMVLAALGRLDAAIAVAQYHVTKDPVNPAPYILLALWYLYSRRWDEAIRAAQTAFDLNPATTYVHAAKGFSLIAQGELDRALAEMNREIEPGFRLEGLAIACHAIGRTEESDRALFELINEYDSRPALIARVYAYRGEADQAFDWLDRAVVNKDSLLLNYIHSPFFDKIRDDPGWLPFLESIGMSPKQLAKIEFEFSLPE